MHRNSFSSLHFLIIIFIVLICNLVLLAPGCSSQTNQKGRDDSRHNKEDLIQTNKRIMRDQSDEIESYLKRRGYSMNLTSTGLRYMIYDSTNTGRKPQTDDIVDVEYKVSLLDGSEVYNSDSTGVLSFTIDKSEIASGFQEGLKYMHEGNKALMIIPAHLAYGLSGDGNKISYYEALVVDTRLLKVKSSHEY